MSNMHRVTVSTFQNVDLTQFLEPDETLLWSGNPCYGKDFFQIVGQERLMHICMLIGCIAMWASLVLIEPTKQTTAASTFTFITILMVGASFFIAKSRQFVLKRLVYFATDRRAIVIRGDKSWQFASALHVISCVHSSEYLYKIVSGHPYPSLRIGSLLSSEQV